MLILLIKVITYNSVIHTAKIGSNHTGKFLFICFCNFEHVGETTLLVSSFFHSNAHVFEFPANYQHKTQISVGHSEEKIN